MQSFMGLFKFFQRPIQTYALFILACAVGNALHNVDAYVCGQFVFQQVARKNIYMCIYKLTLLYILVFKALTII